MVAIGWSLWWMWGPRSPEVILCEIGTGGETADRGVVCRRFRLVELLTCGVCGGKDSREVCFPLSG